MGMPVGRVVKNIEFKIPTLRRELDRSLVVERKLKHLEKNVETLRQEQLDLVGRSGEQAATIATLREEVAALQRGLAQKDEVLNSIFSELGELSKWREEK
jgi:predicted RNase H-like nuclease (RuvC/YqgF family)